MSLRTFPTPPLFDVALRQERPEAPQASPPRVPLDRNLVDALVERAATTGVVLELVDARPGRGQRRRFYTAHLQPRLFGEAVDLVRTWGRLGTVHHHPRHLWTAHVDEPAARAALRVLLLRRLRRGYNAAVSR